MTAVAAFKSALLAELPSLRAFAISLSGSHDHADDLVQETVMKAWGAHASFIPGTSLRAWLFTIMRNRFYSNCIKRNRERTGDEDCASQQPTVSAPQEWQVRIRELEKALEELPVHYREAIVLVVVLEESYARAAEILECDIGTIKSRINRGRRMLRTAMGEEI